MDKLLFNNVMIVPHMPQVANTVEAMILAAKQVQQLTLGKWVALA